MTLRRLIRKKMRWVFAGALFVSAPAAILPIQAAWAAASPSSEKEPFLRLTIPELEAKLKEAQGGKIKLYVYDNNSQERYQKGHIPSARWVDYTKIKESDLPKEKDAMLVFYCSNEH